MDIPPYPLVNTNLKKQVRDVPPEWKKLFQQAGVKKSDLRDPETAKMVINIVGMTIGRAPPPVPGAEGGPPIGPAGIYPQLITTPTIYIYLTHK